MLSIYPNIIFAAQFCIFHASRKRFSSRLYISEFQWWINRILEKKPLFHVENTRLHSTKKSLCRNNGHKVNHIGVHHTYFSGSSLTVIQFMSKRFLSLNEVLFYGRVALSWIFASAAVCFSQLQYLFIISSRYMDLVWMRSLPFQARFDMWTPVSVRKPASQPANHTIFSWRCIEFVEKNDFIQRNLQPTHRPNNRPNDRPTN